MYKEKKMKILISGLLVLCAQILLADASIPSADIKGAKDVSYIGRYDGSKIVAFQHKRFDRFILPLSALKRVEEKRDSHNNNFFSPEKKKILEGENTRLVYLLPAERTPLEVLRNYEDEITAKGGKILFQCEKGECGGDAGRSCAGGGGDMSLSMFMQHEEDVLTYNKPFSNGYCALLSRINDQHYFSAELPEENAYVSVLTYMVSNHSSCKAFDGRTVAVVDVVKMKKREQKMVVIKADEMSKKIDAEGKIALYGIYFDTDKAVIKDKSVATMDEIAKMLKQNPKEKILIVGHTDTEGTFEYNQKLSDKRAKAVVQMLVEKYGISLKRLHAAGASYACPAASNSTEEGREKNRRVVLVKE